MFTAGDMVSRMYLTLTVGAVVVFGIGIVAHLRNWPKRLWTWTMFVATIVWFFLIWAWAMGAPLFFALLLTAVFAPLGWFFGIGGGIGWAEFGQQLNERRREKEANGNEDNMGSP